MRHRLQSLKRFINCPLHKEKTAPEQLNFDLDKRVG